MKIKPISCIWILSTCNTGCKRRRSNKRTDENVSACWEKKGGAKVIKEKVISRCTYLLDQLFFTERGNENAATLSGTNIKKIKIAVYTIAGMLAAVGGILVTRVPMLHNPMLERATSSIQSLQLLSAALRFQVAEAACWVLCSA